MGVVEGLLGALLVLVLAALLVLLCREFLLSK